MANFHKPVLLKEVLNYLNIKKEELYLDATVGGGGHAAAILEKGGRILGIDCDPAAVKAAREYLSQACPIPVSNRGYGVSWRLAQGNFAHLKTIAEKEGFSPVAGVLFDLGVSFYQLKRSQRGFSFDSQVALDMRMDPELKVTAADLVNGLSKKELNELFKKLADEKYSWRCAEAICRARKIRAIKSSQALAKIIEKAKGKKRGRIHPATGVFQALRIAVNDELNNLKKALPQAAELLKPKGRLVIISFHSGEDRIVKQFFKSRSDFLILTKKPVRSQADESRKNPCSRSAKLRAGEKR
jgi:16S rRNA (cytosine1402-N4)-methyltransferase